MKVLITSPRAPVTTEWIRIAQRGGHQVQLVDSLRFPVARFMSQVDYRRIASPRLSFEVYQQQMMTLIEQADYVIPTCEEIFYLAQLPLSSAARQKCLMPDTDLLLRLHHKQDVFACLNNHVACPETRLITALDDIVTDENNGQKSVLKPVFSRFGRSVIRGVSANSMRQKNFSPSVKQPWVQQTFIDGQPLCNYAVCEHGKVIAHSVYRPKYLLNQSAATYFEPLTDMRCEAFIHQFAADHAYHGQVAFDFIDDGDKLWVLECNPRATSGLHIVAKMLQLSAAGQLRVQGQPSGQDLRIGASLPILFGVQAVKQWRFRQLWHDYRRAIDITADLPWYANGLALSEMLWRSVRYRQPWTSASTFDIEYDDV